jgi:DNA-binding transcriptional ArsR family regulator
LLVLDVDDLKLFADYMQRKGLIVPETRTVETGGGKFHYYFRYPRDGRRYRCRSFKKCGFDIRGAGGCVVAPGSIHPRCRAYRVQDETVSIAPAPLWVMNLCGEGEPSAPPPAAGVTVTTERNEEETLPPPLDALGVSDHIRSLISDPPLVGQRSEAMMRVINALVRANLSDDQILAIFERDPIGQKYREMGANRQQWLITQIQKARAFVQGDFPMPEGFTASQLMAMEFKEPVWAIPGVVPEGVTLFCGKPKVGKSWLALNLGVAVASGGKALGDILVKPGRVLYLALEDPLRRLQGRLSTVLQGASPPENLHLFTSWPMFDASQKGLDHLKAWMDEHPDTRLIIIDTLAKVRERRPGSGKLYEEDYRALEGIKALADSHNVAVLVVHRLNKREADDKIDQVSGTTGLTGAADTILILQRGGKGVADAFLYVNGRDVEERELALKFKRDACSWHLLGDGEKYRLSQQRQEVLDVLRQSGRPLSPKEIAETLGKKVNTIMKTLSRLKADGLVTQPEEGKYIIAVM